MITILFSNAGDIVSGMNSTATDFIGSLAPIAELLIGLLLAFLVINVIIGMLYKKKKYDPDDPDDPYDPDWDEDTLPEIDW